MIKIDNNNLEVILNEHYESIKNKLKDFPSDCKYSLEEVIKATPKKLEEIAKWSEEKIDDYQFMIKKYENFITKKKEYNSYDLANKLQVNICPYCNMNYTYTVIKKDGKKVTRPEFDHFYDKATYPILALSFYNLIPSCHICNATLKGREKFSIKTHLNPYHESFDKNVKFHLKIENSNFYYSINGFSLILESDNIKVINQIKSFELNTLYQNHKDTVLELIQKEIIYNESYMAELMQNYEGTLFKNEEDILRLITCGYVDDKDLHKRPLSKLIKDISEELELL